MKDLVLVAVNAKYIHTNLAVRSLKAQLPDFKVEIVELSINDSIHRIVEHLLATDGKLFGFSCYIWNMELMLKITELLKKSKPEARIILGGPEVSFDSKEILNTTPWIDFIIAGEGETSLKKLLLSIDDESSLNKIPGLWFRNNQDCVASGPPEIPMDLNALTFPYVSDELLALKNKIIYYETMRGCPYRCSYCLSSANQGVRTLSLERVFKEIDFFIALEMKQVKLVDRTFNFDMKRAKAIFSYIIARGGNTNFHFEMTGDLLDDELVALLKEAAPGLIQLEIGVQSTDSTTLQAIDRKTDLTRLEVNVKSILDSENIHLHLDLIAGLPYESYAIFKTSFNRTIALKPDMLQLGFLKCLKGTRIRDEGDLHQYTYTSFPPYEVISNAYISSQELYRLRNIEILVDRFYNSDGFRHSLGYLFEQDIFTSPFDFFESFSDYWTTQGYFDIGKSKEQLYAILLDFLKPFSGDGMVQELIKFDYLKQGNSHIPCFFEDTSPEKEWIFEFLKDVENVAAYLPEFIGIPAKKIFTQVKFQRFASNFSSYLNSSDSSPEKKPSLGVFHNGQFKFITA
ncbi:B12-binding domain-containing radical SAM protein [Acetobacterium bakii]|uniref:B12-binding domain-containing radical SAM protein n=1 Tax=Acetobacterium bakii TaxID=52689 RepID=UPI000681D5F3|nr:B12-binding domain-containing radical SAM protein [Acetobacterium bakii]